MADDTIISAMKALESRLADKYENMTDASSAHDSIFGASENITPVKVVIEAPDINLSGGDIDG